MRWSCGLFSSPSQKAPATLSSLNALILPVDGMCGPRQKSRNLPVLDGDGLIGLGELLDEVTLHEVAFVLEAGEPFGVGNEFARVRQVGLGEFLHLLLNGFEVFGREWLVAQEV